MLTIRILRALPIGEFACGMDRLKRTKVKNPGQSKIPIRGEGRGLQDQINDRYEDIDA